MYKFEEFFLCSFIINQQLAVRARSQYVSGFVKNKILINIRLALSYFCSFSNDMINKYIHTESRHKGGKWLKNTRIMLAVRAFARLWGG